MEMKWRDPGHAINGKTIDSFPENQTAVLSHLATLTANALIFQTWVVAHTASSLLSHHKFLHANPACGGDLPILGVDECAENNG